ncbi:MAG: SsrA-binding protein [Patescibacteria group bacterium]|jgi:SsrA-binding protein|nr:SsrA-binding protein [Patescibacteria group bacterium]
MKVVATNKRAKYDYEISERIVAGIVLSGQEVKSIKLGNVSLKGSYVSLQNNEAYLKNAHVNQYKMATNLEGYNPTQDRKLLLHKKELVGLVNAIKSEGKIVVPARIGIHKGLIKVEIAIGKSKKRYDKRETIKKRDMLRDVGLEVKKNK